MAHIIGLDEQKKALANIRTLLKEIHVINEFLLTDNTSGIYEISYKIKNPDFVDDQEQMMDKKEIDGMDEIPENQNESSLYPLDDSSNDSVNDDSNDEKIKRIPEYIKISAPFICHDRDVVRRHVLQCKKEKYDKVKEMSHKYRIFLDENEEAILNMFEEEMR